MPWDGTERRQNDEILRELSELKMIMEAHLKEEQDLRPRLLELLTILERSKGAILLLKTLFFIGAPVSAFVYWIKDHVKL